MEDIVKVETAKLAKAAGFDWEVVDMYDSDTNLLVPKSVAIINPAQFAGDQFSKDYRDECVRIHMLYKDKFVPAPTQTQLYKWLRDAKGLDLDVTSYGIAGRNRCYETVVRLSQTLLFDELREDIGFDIFDTYEEALEHGLQLALEQLVD